MLGTPAELNQLAQQCITSYEMDISFGLAHAVRGEGDEDCIVLKEVQDSNPGNLHIEELLIVVIELAFRLVYLQEAGEYIFVDVVSD